MARSITVRGIRIAYQERGRGLPVLLLHGFCASRYSWQRVTDRLGDGHRLIAPDLKGHGESDKPEDDRYALDDHVAVICDLIDALGLDDLVIAGNSLGGGVALVTTLRLNGRDGGPIRGLVLVDAMSYRQEIPAFIRLLGTPGLGKAALWIVPPRVGALSVLRKVYFDEKRITEETIRVYADAMSAPGAHAAMSATARRIVPNGAEAIEAQYPSIRVPALVIWGDRDEIIPVALGRRLADDLPLARFVELSHCGHAPQEEMPEATADLVGGFLADLDAGVSR